MLSVLSRSMIAAVASLTLVACGGDKLTGDVPAKTKISKKQSSPPAGFGQPVKPEVVPQARDIYEQNRASPPVVVEPAVQEQVPVEDELAALAAEAATHPRDAEIRIELARKLLSAGDGKAARRHAERATELRPKWSTAWNTLGRAELAVGAVEDAIVSFQTAVEINDSNVHAWNNLGLALMRTRQWSEAVDALEQAVDADDVEPYMWNNLGMAYEHVDRLDDARHAYEQAAAAGSTAAVANRERLEGVESIVGAEVDDDSGTTGTH